MDGAVGGHEDILARICADTRAEVARRKAITSLDALKHQIRDLEKPRGFGRALMDATAAGKPGLITEIKKSSPSGGLIRADFDPAALARAYAQGGAICLSVLTDAPYFQGSPEHLQAARAAVKLPVLRKDFILDPWQVYESRAIGADCILLIMSALGDAQARDLEELARALEMDVLAEVHDDAELDRALGLCTPLLGINNRNLKTMETSLETTERLSKSVPPDRFLISESGIKTNADIKRLQKVCVQGFLVGEAIDARGRCDIGGAQAFGIGVNRLSHIDDAGHARMVDVSAKAETVREAAAKGRVTMLAETLALIGSGKAAKGDVLAVARVAGIMAAKKTADLIPLCHPLPISSVTVDLALNEADLAVDITATVRTTGRTGVEMEALTAVSVAALTIYDMVKAVDRGMRIENIRVVAKSGGKSGGFTQA